MSTLLNRRKLLAASAVAPAAMALGPGYCGGIAKGDAPKQRASRAAETCINNCLR